MKSFCDVPILYGVSAGFGELGELGGLALGDEAVGVTADGHGGRLPVQDLDLGC